MCSGCSPAGVDSSEDLCILYSNRAACYLKDGSSTDCIQDCTKYVIKYQLCACVLQLDCQQFGERFMCPVLAADNRASTGCDEQSDEPAAFLLHTLFFFPFSSFQSSDPNQC